MKPNVAVLPGLFTDQILALSSTKARYRRRQRLIKAIGWAARPIPDGPGANE